MAGSPSRRPSMSLKSTAFAQSRPQAGLHDSLREEPASPCGRSQKQSEWLKVKQPGSHQEERQIAVLPDGPGCCFDPPWLQSLTGT